MVGRRRLVAPGPRSVRSVWVVLGMDPDETVRQIQRAFAEIDDYRDGSLSDADVLEALENAGRMLTEHCEALREWQARGGFLRGSRWGAS